MTLTADKPNAAEIQRDIESDRRRIEERIDAIQEKMSPGQLIDEVLGYVKSSGGGEYAANLGSAIKANPIPMALMGVSLAWLMTGQNSQWTNADKARDSDLYPLAIVTGEVRRTGPIQEEGGMSYSHFADAAGNRFKALTDTVGKRAGYFIDESGRSYRGFADAAGNRVTSIKDEAGAMLDDASGWISDTWQQVSDTAHDLSDKVADKARQFSHTSASAGRVFQDQTTRLNESILAHFRDQPLVGGALAFAVGAAIGAALPPTQVEDSVAGEAAESVKDSISDKAEDILDKGKEAASDIYDQTAAVVDDAYEAASGRIKDATSADHT
ncbi:DUF3618 domain-containing protein [Candidatus Phyllobacterium onerii]|uniref:DUF3618 domain-containing protein n=1 Tax=Candidatus Phyllobacterium onerii TaxID=3020828 RepID=UPI00233003FA|nr:DUF3618 domain-containing protein [Phyllobacterium sp. IY22]